MQETHQSSVAVNATHAYTHTRVRGEKRMVCLRERKRDRLKDEGEVDERERERERASMELHGR